MNLLIIQSNITVKDEVGVLSSITALLAKRGVSVAAMVQKTKSTEGVVKLIFITHEAHENDIEAAIQDILELPAVVMINNIIRVEN